MVILHFLLPRNVIMLAVICQVAAYGRLKTKDNIRLLALKVVASAYNS